MDERKKGVALVKELYTSSNLMNYKNSRVVYKNA
jgi:hypothetical protein